MPVEIIAGLVVWSYVATGFAVWACCLDLHSHAGWALPRFLIGWLPALVWDRARRWVAR